MDRREPQPRGGIHRSSSSEPLLESVPSSHCMAAVAGGEEAVIPTLEKAVLMVSMQEKVVMVASEERPSSRTVVSEECGGQAGGAPWSYVGRLFSNEASSVGVANKEGETSYREVEEVPEREEKKGKLKKRWSWRPDPEKRWPVQGW